MCLSSIFIVKNHRAKWKSFCLQMTTVLFSENNTPLIIKPFLNKLIFFMKKYFLPLLLLITACGSNSQKTEKTQTEEQKQPGSQTSTTVNEPKAEEASAMVSFKVNNVDANTKPSSKDNDKQLGLINVQNMQLSFDLMGDDPSKLHRGWLHFTIENFKFEAAKYALQSKASARFTRYETENAGGATDYNANSQPKYKGSELSIEFTSVVKDEKAQFGEVWLVSGTFSSKLLLNEFSKNDIKSIDITEGKFTNVPVTVLGRK